MTCETCGLWSDCNKFEEIWDNIKTCENWITIDYRKLLTNTKEYNKITAKGVDIKFES